MTALTSGSLALAQNGGTLGAGGHSQPNAYRLANPSEGPQPNTYFLRPSGSRSHALGVDFRNDGRGLRVASHPNFGSLGQRSGLEMGDRVVRVNSAAAHDASQIDQAIRHNGSASLVVENVRNGQYVTVNVHGRPGGGGQGGGGQGGGIPNVGAMSISVTNTMFTPIRVDVRAFDGSTQSYRVQAQQSRNIRIVAGSSAVVRAGVLSLPLDNVQRGARYTVSRRGNSMHVSAAFAPRPVDPFGTHPVDPFGTHPTDPFGTHDHEPGPIGPAPAPEDRIQVLANALQVMGPTMQGFGGDSLLIRRVRMGGVGQRLGLRSGDRIRPASAVGIPVRPGFPAQHGSILTSIAVERNGRTFDVSVRGNGLEIVLP